MLRNGSAVRHSLALAAAAVLCLLVALPAHAEQTCPWLTLGSAESVLGGAVASEVTGTKATDEDGRCAFEMRGRAGETKQAELSRLTIEVTTMSKPQSDFASYTAKCVTKTTPLKAIGNEALVCGGKDQTESWELIIGRVRDRAFVIRLTTNASPTVSDQMRERVRKAAELVASILF